MYFFGRIFHVQLPVGIIEFIETTNKDVFVSSSIVKNSLSSFKKICFLSQGKKFIGSLLCVLN